MPRLCFALDLKNDPNLIREYEIHHQKVWPEILQSLKDAGILQAEIYRTGARLFMILETNEQFSFARKTLSDSVNPKVQEWETLMWKYQQALPHASQGEKWVKLERIFQFD